MGFIWKVKGALWTFCQPFWFIVHFRLVVDILHHAEQLAVGVGCEVEGFIGERRFSKWVPGWLGARWLSACEFICSPAQGRKWWPPAGYRMANSTMHASSWFMCMQVIHNVVLFARRKLWSKMRGLSNLPHSLFPFSWKLPDLLSHSLNFDLYLTVFMTLFTKYWEK